MILPIERNWGRRIACLTHHLGTGGISKALTETRKRSQATTDVQSFSIKLLGSELVPAIMNAALQ